MPLDVGFSPEYTDSFKNMPEGLKERWVSLIYKEIEGRRTLPLISLYLFWKTPRSIFLGMEKTRKAQLQLKGPCRDNGPA
jgi:hypothetical protein